MVGLSRNLTHRPPILIPSPRVNGVRALCATARLPLPSGEGMRVRALILISSPAGEGTLTPTIPAGAHEHPVRPFDGANVHRTFATSPSPLPQAGEGSFVRSEPCAPRAITYDLHQPACLSNSSGRSALENTFCTSSRFSSESRSSIRFSASSPLTGADAEQLLKLLDALEDLEDVQNVFSNADLPEELLKQAG